MTGIRDRSAPLIIACLLASALVPAVGWAAGPAAGSTPSRRPADPRRPPPTAVEPVVDRLHGEEIVDPYRWLEGSAAPEIEGEAEELDAEVEAWASAQSVYARRVLDGIPGRERVAERLRELLAAGEISHPRLAGDRTFLRRRDPGEEQAKLVVHGADGDDPRVLLDPDRLDGSGLTGLSWVEPSRDGSRVAFGLVTAGKEADVRIRLLDTASGRWLADEIPGRAGDVSWRPGGGSFVYRRLVDPDDPYSESIRYHRVGRHHRHDPVLLAQAEEGPLATTWGPRARLSDDGRWLLLKYWTSTAGHDLWVADFERWLESGELERREVHTGREVKSDGVVVGDTLYLHTTLGAANGRVVAADLAAPGHERWREVVAEHPRAVVQRLAVGDGVLAVEYLEAAVSRIERFRLDGTALGELPLPGPGAAELVAAPGSDAALLTFESFDTPRSVFRADLGAGTVEPWLAPEMTVDPDSVAVRQVFYPSLDGTRVPMFVIHREGLELDGERPTLVYAYGGFGASWSPRFDPTWFLLFERGAVVAVANLRGGGELGERWHRDGMRESKVHTIDDWIAALEYLIEEGYTRPQRLAVATGSNGGIAAAAMMNRRPDLLAAAVMVNPLLDMLRYQHFLLARYWVPEYGSAEDPEAFRWLSGYSPYHRVRQDVEYPAMLIEAAVNDARVHPLHSYKYAARVQTATAAEPAEAPVLLYRLEDTGHGVGQSREQQVQGDADKRAFVMWQLGMLGEDAELVGESAADPTGLWRGVLINRRAEMEVALTVEIGAAAGNTADAALAGTLDVPAYDLQFVPLEEIAVDGERVGFRFRRYSENLERETLGVFDGRFAAGGRRLAGDYREAGFEMRFELERLGEPGMERPQPGERPLVSLEPSVAALREAFNDRPDAVRLLLLLSPDCPICKISAGVVQRHVLERIGGDELVPLVVWGPMLERETEAQARAATTLVPDPRSRHFWIAGHDLAERLAPAVGLPEGERAWDVYLLYRPGVRWRGDVPPEPDLALHVGLSLPPERRLNGDALRRAAERLLGRSPTPPAPPAGRTELPRPAVESAASTEDR